MSRTRFEASLDKARARDDAEKAGVIADSLDVRMALMKRVHDGEITLEEAQRQLKKIKSSAKKNGLITRQQAYSQG